MRRETAGSGGGRAEAAGGGGAEAVSSEQSKRRGHDEWRDKNSRRGGVKGAGWEIIRFCRDVNPFGCIFGSYPGW